MRQKNILLAIDLLPVETMTRTEIASTVGCNYSSVNRFLRQSPRKCIDLRYSGRNESDEKNICELYTSGYSLSEVTDKTGCEQTSVTNILKKHNVPMRHTGRSSNVCNLSDITESYISGDSFMIIEKKFHCGQNVIRRALKQAGINPRKAPNPMLPLDENLIISLYQSGKTAVYIAKQFGCTNTTIANRLIHNGIKMHPQTGEHSSNWKGGITPELMAARNNTQYDRWRIAVFERDNYTCQNCDDRQGHNLNAHHIISFARNKELRYNIDNGITLCAPCHRRIHRMAH